MPESNQVRVVGRYALYNAIAAGGMATVHLGRLLGPVGFSRTVAIKRLHAQFASDPEFVSMFLDEARLAARIRHPNVVPTLDVVATGGELFLVMEYVPGESLSRLTRALREQHQTIPLRIISASIAGVLYGLHAAHEAKDERGHPLGIVHRDVSPQNVLIGTDGVPRVLDFGVAKAAGRAQTTKEGQIKGKLSYMPPEQLRGAAVSRQTDIYAVGVMLWELLTGQRLFGGDNEGVIVAKILEGHIEPPSAFLMRSRRLTLMDDTHRQLESLDATVLRALHMQPEVRFATAREMALEIERKLPPATTNECSVWVEATARSVLSSRAAIVAEIESSASMSLDAHQHENAVNAVLNAKATLGPDARVPSIHDGSPPPHRQPSLASAVALPSHPITVPPTTQPSSISVSTASPNQPRKADRRTVVATLLAVLVSLSVLVGALLYRQSKRPRPEVGSAPSSSVAPSAPTHSLPPLGTPTASPPTADLDAPDAEPRPPVASSPTVHPPPPKSTATPSPIKVKTPPAPAKSTVTAPSTASPDDCSTPFWYDKEGVKHYKEHCVGK